MDQRIFHFIMQWYYSNINIALMCNTDHGGCAINVSRYNIYLHSAQNMREINGNRRTN